MPTNKNDLVPGFELAVGRIVHVRGPKTGKCLAAIITEVNRSASADYGRVLVFACEGEDTESMEIEDDSGRIYHDPRGCPFDGGAK